MLTENWKILLYYESESVAEQNIAQIEHGFYCFEK